MSRARPPRITHGTALASLSGTIRNTRTLPVAEAEVSALWYVDGPSSDRTVSDAVEVAGCLPERSSPSIFEPPAMDVLDDAPGAPSGVACLAVFLAGTDDATEESAPAGWLPAPPRRIPAGRSC